MRRAKRKPVTSLVKRTGVPLMVYLRGDQASRLQQLCETRRVTKTAIVQFAIDRVFVDMENGQLQLPLGIER